MFVLHGKRIGTYLHSTNSINKTDSRKITYSLSETCHRSPSFFSEKESGRRAWEAREASNTGGIGNYKRNSGVSSSSYLYCDNEIIGIFYPSLNKQKIA